MPAKQTSLKDAKPVSERDPNRTSVVLIYGDSGTGKTTFASSCKKPALLLDVNGERGTDSISDVDDIDVLKVNSKTDLDYLIDELTSTEHKYNSIIIDTLTNVQDMLVEDQKAIKVNRAGALHLNQWGAIGTSMRDLVHDLKTSGNADIILLCQERDDSNDDDNSTTIDGEVITTVGPRLSPSIADFVKAASDVIVNTFKRVHKTKEKVDNKVVTRQTVVYSLRVGAHEVFSTKVRVPKSVKLPLYMDNPSIADVLNLKESTQNGNPKKPQSTRRRNRRRSKT